MSDLFILAGVALLVGYGVPGIDQVSNPAPVFFVWGVGIALIVVGFCIGARHEGNL